MRQTRNELLSRVDIAQPLGVVLQEIARQYELGRVGHARLITQGYDDLNVLLDCERGRYVAKFFNQTKSIAMIEDHVRVQLALTRRRAPVPRILTKNGVGLYRVEGRSHDTFVCVSTFFAGKNLIQQPPQREDMLNITNFLATLHRLPLQITANYDSWGTLNLPGEFARKRTVVSDETIRLVAPLADAIAAMNFGRARRRVIHGDLQRKHVLKDDVGRYCILDFGCIGLSYPIVDLGIFLALCCLEGSKPSQAQRIIADVLTAYQDKVTLPVRHTALLATLIRATWASYLLTSDFLMRQGDRSRQTRQWYRFALASLRAFDASL